MTDKYDKEIEVYFHEGEYADYFCTIGDPDKETMGDALILTEEVREQLEPQHGSHYERAVDPGEHVYTGTLKFNSSAIPVDGYDVPDDAWVFNQIPARELDVERDGLTYDQEGGIEGLRISSPIDILETARELNVATGALFGVVDNYESRFDIDRHSEHKIETIHAYDNAIALAELTTPIGHNVNPEPYALINFEGYAFPFTVKDLDYIKEHFNEAGLLDDNEHA